MGVVFGEGEDEVACYLLREGGCGRCYGEGELGNCVLSWSLFIRMILSYMLPQLFHGVGAGHVASDHRRHSSRDLSFDLFLSEFLGPKDEGEWEKRSPET